MKNSFITSRPEIFVLLACIRLSAAFGTMLKGFIDVITVICLKFDKKVY